MFVAGDVVRWLRDGLGLIERAADVEALAASVPDAGGVVLVPAFSGLGAPDWDPEARGILTGLTAGTTGAHLARAALEAIAFQVADLLGLMATAGVAPDELRVDGGAAANRLLLELQADLAGVRLARSADTELTCRGAAALALIGAGLADRRRRAAGRAAVRPRARAAASTPTSARAATALAGRRGPGPGALTVSPFLALGAACCWGVGDFFGGLMSRRQSVLAVVWISQIVGLIAVGAIVLVRGSGLPDTAELLWAVAAGVFTVATLIGFFGGMARGPMSLVAPISATGVSIPVLVGIAGGERPSLLQLVGIAAACAGIVLAARESGDADAVGLKRVHVCVWFALLAALGGGSQLVSLDRAAEHDALFAVLLMRGTSVAIFTVAGLIVRPAVARETLPLLALIGILDTTAVVLFAAAAAEGLLSVSAVLACLYPVVTVGLARVRLGERLAGAQAAGVGLAFAGILLVTGG